MADDIFIFRLSDQLVKFLSVTLPSLMWPNSSDARQEVVKAIGEDAMNLAERLWGTLKPHVNASQALREAMTDLASNPGCSDAREALRWQLRKMLNANSSLASDVNQILSNPDVQGIVMREDTNQENAPPRSVRIGGSISNSVIITGSGKVITS